MNEQKSNVLATCPAPPGWRRRSAALRLAAVLALGSMMPSAQMGVAWTAEATGAAPGAQSDPTAVAPTRPVTTAFIEIDLADLELMLEPMAKPELEVEARGWFDLLRGKVREISEAELAVRRKNREVAQLEKVQAAAEEVAEAKADITEQAADGGSTEQTAAAAEDLTEAQQELEKAIEQTKEAAAAPQPTVAPARAAEDVDATGTGAAHAAPPVDDQAIMDKAVEEARSNAEETGDSSKVMETVVAAVKDTSASEQVEALAEAIPTAVKTASAGATAMSVAASASAGQAEELSAKVEEAQAAKTQVKVALIDYSTQLANDRIAIGDRLKLVLDAWEAKGGDPAEYRLYMASVGGLKIDVEDQTATLARIKAWLMADEGGMRWARNLGIFAAYVLGSLIFAWITRVVLRGILSRARMSSKLLRDFLVDMSGRAIVFIGVLLGLSALEVNLAPILAVVGAAGFVVAFALQGTLSNFASGLLILINKPFDVGDEVEVGGEIKGRVSAVSIFSSMIETEEGFRKIVPNNTIWAGVISNYTTGTVANPTHADPAKAV
jgi:small conductance mechanosensitive channel